MRMLRLRLHERKCVPKKEGGLGLKRLDVWNQAAMLRHIWNLFAEASSLWVAWVDENWLRGRSFWQIPIYTSILLLELEANLV
jgi:hypothetical protein